MLFAVRLWNRRDVLPGLAATGIHVWRIGMNPSRDSTAGTVDLTAAGEARFLAHALRRGGYVVSATTPEADTAEVVAAALAIVERTLDALEHVVATAEPANIIHDVLPPYGRAG